MKVLSHNINRYLAIEEEVVIKTNGKADFNKARDDMRNKGFEHSHFVENDQRFELFIKHTELKEFEAGSDLIVLKKIIDVNLLQLRIDLDLAKNNHDGWHRTQLNSKIEVYEDMKSIVDKMLEQSKSK